MTGLVAVALAGEPIGCGAPFDAGDDGYLAPEEGELGVVAAARDLAASWPGEGGAPPAEGGSPPADGGPPAEAERDVFGVRKLVPTAPGGREWVLPEDATVRGPEWHPESLTITRVSPGVFTTSGQVRLNVPSPQGRAWWRNVEMTGYFRQTGMAGGGPSPHWELFARGERHSASNPAPGAINLGVPAPPGTETWPGYPFGDLGSVNGRCLGSSYHGNFYTTGRSLFEKEITHTAGYAAQKGTVHASGWASPPDQWFGLKYVLRNNVAGTRVHMELWLDADATGAWTKLTELDDVPGGWASTSDSLDGCTAAPFRYTPSQLITWAGPWATFRSDSLVMEFRWLSVREIPPLP